MRRGRCSASMALPPRDECIFCRCFSLWVSTWRIFSLACYFLTSQWAYSSSYSVNILWIFVKLFCEYSHWLVIRWTFYWLLCCDSFQWLLVLWMFSIDGKCSLVKPWLLFCDYTSRWCEGPPFSFLRHGNDPRWVNSIHTFTSLSIDPHCLCRVSWPCVFALCLVSLACVLHVVTKPNLNLSRPLVYTVQLC